MFMRKFYIVGRVQFSVGGHLLRKLLSRVLYFGFEETLL